MMGEPLEQACRCRMCVPTLAITKNHIIIESFQLKGILKSHLVQPPCNKQGHLLDQVAQSLAQPNLESIYQSIEIVQVLLSSWLCEELSCGIPLQSVV